MEQAIQLDAVGVVAVHDAGVLDGVPLDELDWAIERESGWLEFPVGKVDGRAIAAGLLMWTGATLKGMTDPRTGKKGLTIADVATMRMKDQAGLVLEHFAPPSPGHPHGFVHKRPGDTYLWNAAPGFFDRPEETIIFDVGTKAWAQNEGLRESKNGPITVLSILEIGRTPAGKLVHHDIPPGRKSGGSSSPGIALVILLLLLFGSRK